MPCFVDFIIIFVFRGDESSEGEETNWIFLFFSLLQSLDARFGADFERLIPLQMKSFKQISAIGP